MTAGPDAEFFQAVAHCLDYPDEQFFERLPMLAHSAGELTPFLDHARTLGREALAEHYVATFDFRKQHCLHLTWWLDGDTRRRGQSLLSIKQLYRDHGMHLNGVELPDYLPVVLEFTAATGRRELLIEHRPGLELLRLALADNESPYAGVVTALCARLPGTSPRDRAAVLALARSGPRTESVGLAAYGHLALLPVLGNGGHR
ncbi:nitrate reductase molybdenum cofactor assembly chaperone [Nocardia jejuensis]|uniref:nitrate reductase molybdenum cofactor assembly chaperone n=1 Tax=Nocardia jejuensis TaxID=328049 RepID=UPI0008337E8C|nr:nitrate reductase molybdenum cofactor assembly chaperone [Nocardia jejuensis]